MSTVSVTVTIDADGIGESDLRAIVGRACTDAVLNELGEGETYEVEIHDEPHPAYRNVQTGRYVSAEEAAAHPDVTVHET